MKTEIEAMTAALDWRELPAKQDSQIMRIRENVDIMGRATWPDAFAWLKREAEQFMRVFVPRIKALPIAGEPDEPEVEEQ